MPESSHLAGVTTERGVLGGARTGWAYPVPGVMGHYFNRGGSLCLRWGIFYRLKRERIPQHRCCRLCWRRRMES